MPTADLIGYADRLSARPGETVRFMVSTTADTFRAQIIRLDGLTAGGHPARATLVRDIGHYAGRVQPIHPGSFVLVPDVDTLRFADGMTVHAWVYPTLPGSGQDQGIVAKWSAARQEGFALLVDAAGHLALQIGDGRGRVARVRASAPLRAGRWVLAAAVYAGSGQGRLVWRERADGWLAGDAGAAEITAGPDLADAPEAPLLIGAMTMETDDRGATFASGCYNGKIDRPRLWRRVLSPAEIAALVADADAPGLADALVGDWDFSAAISSTTVVDHSPSRALGQAVNLPVRGVTGHRWDGSEDSFLAKPEHYGGMAFHEDALEDCGWESDFAFAVPPDLPSGLYAARLEADGNQEEIPFYVRPEVGSASAPILFLAPTNTYLAYANFRLNITTASQEGSGTPPPGRLAHTDELLVARPDLGASLYDHHRDGAGICYSSRLRPIVTMRSDAIEATTGAPRHFAADLCLIAWLDREGFVYDVATDEDLHLDGAALLRSYRVVLTGSHPEYWTGPMLDALEAYLSGGGRLMYLGGNGFYWVTAMDAGRPHLIEIRRGTSGTRTWSSAPGEMRLSLSGEPGGLWRHRGRSPNRLCGLGFAAQGWDAAAGYTRLPDSHDPRAAFIFAGVGAEEIIGDFGLVLGGAAGDEVDRYDLDLGTPPETLRLATSQGGHSDAYQLVVEDTMATQPGRGGAACDQVRSDLTVLQSGVRGGAVFSVGSINWIASLPHNAGDNNVARITRNVLRRFAARGDGEEKS